jgi:hypothetical protein
MKVVFSHQMMAWKTCLSDMSQQTNPGMFGLFVFERFNLTSHHVSVDARRATRVINDSNGLLYLYTV